jgi:hypothetical protein
MAITISVTIKNERTGEKVSPAPGGSVLDLGCVAGDKLTISGQVTKDGVGYACKVRLARWDTYTHIFDYDNIYQTDSNGNFSISYTVDQTYWTDEPNESKNYLLELYRG